MAAMVAPPIESDEELQQLYNWVDEVPLSRPKRNIARDFADGVLFAEVISHHFPKIVELHNYSSANSVPQKMYNWNTLNTKVLKRLGYTIHQSDLEEIAKASPGAAERLLKVLREKVMLAQKGQLRVERRSVASGGPGSAASPAAERGRVAGAVSSEDGGRRAAVSPAPNIQRYQEEVDNELLVEKEQEIMELRETVQIMTEKIKKLEQLVVIKDSKIEAMCKTLQKHGLA
eukprot:TRINITY_DN67299_c0_g1_i1.p1 TRINITY_DN67299_c0_g1~~TRINITY_DN67299_c0_g1_i1.p1  ORF type:complete len:231 (+),score=48.32 TRINITY_DN67299_c0_g1_i1:71-763(+)